MKLRRVVLRLGPAQVFYLKRLLARGLAGGTLDEVVESVFLAGLREMVPPDWMREWVEKHAPRASTRLCRS